MPSFKTYIFNLLPQYFKRYDSYKDNNSQGLVERFLETLGKEWDENLLVKLENVIELYNIRLQNDDFITLYAKMFGSPPDITNDGCYCRLLSYIVSIYKIRGTWESFQLYFDFVGYNVSIVEYNKPSINYGNFNYDDGSHYDVNCDSCTEIDIIFVPKSHDSSNPEKTNITKSEFESLLKVVEFNLPINVSVRGFIASVPYFEPLNVGVREDIRVQVIQSIAYDTPGISYDDNLDYDVSDVVSDELYTILETEQAP